MFCPDYLQDSFLYFTTFFQYWCFILLSVCGLAQSAKVHSFLHHSMHDAVICLHTTGILQQECMYLITNPCILKKGWLCIETKQRRCVESVYDESPHKLSFDTKLSYTTTSDIGLNGLPSHSDSGNREKKCLPLLRIKLS